MGLVKTDTVVALELSFHHPQVGADCSLPKLGGYDIILVFNSLGLRVSMVDFMSCCMTIATGLNEVLKLPQ